MWGARGWALSHARPPVLQACGRGPLSTSCGCGGVGVGTRRQAVGAARGRPRGGVGRLLPGFRASAVGRSPTPDCPALGRAAVAHYPLALGAGGVGVATRNQSPSVRSCKLALCVAGRQEGARGGGVFYLGLEPSRLGALPCPTACPWDVRPGPATHWLWVRGVWAWGPVINPTAHALASWLCALWGQHNGAPEGRLWPECEASGIGRSPTPDHTSLGRAAGARYPLAMGAWSVGVGASHQSHSARSYGLALRAVGRHEGAQGGGGRLLPACGTSRVGRSPTPKLPSFGRAAGARYPLDGGAGLVGVGTRHRRHSARSCKLALRAVGAAGRRQGEAPLACVWGVWGGALTHPRPPVLGACGQVALPTGHGCGECGCRDSPPIPQRALLRAGFARCGAARGFPWGGGGLLPGVGRPRWGAIPRPTACPLGVQPGPATHWLLVRRCGRGDPSPTPQRALWRAGFARCGGSTRVPGGRSLLPGCGASGAGRSHARPPVLGACSRGPILTGCGCRGCERGDPSPTPQRSLLRAGFACCGGGTRAPRGGTP